MHMFCFVHEFQRGLCEHEGCIEMLNFIVFNDTDVPVTLINLHYRGSSCTSCCQLSDTVTTAVTGSQLSYCQRGPHTGKYW